MPPGLPADFNGLVDDCACLPRFFPKVAVFVFIPVSRRVLPIILAGIFLIPAVTISQPADIQQSYCMAWFMRWCLIDITHQSLFENL